jgi:DNA-binding GntR family transcriptional regulator
MPSGGLSKRPPTAQTAVLRELRREILSGDMAPGSQIMQDDIAERYGVSRVPVRDALRTLEGQGLVTYSPHRGYHVTGIDVAELQQLQDLRQILEGEALREAVDNVTAETVTAMTTDLEAMIRAEKEADWSEWLAAHRRFHFALFAMSGRKHLLRILGQLWDVSDLYRSYYMKTRLSEVRDRHEHQQLLNAARDHDLDAMLETMRAHRSGTVESIRSTVSGSAPTGE